MRKQEIWKDRSGGLWEILVADKAGKYPIMAKSLSSDRTGAHLFTESGKYHDDDVSPFDLIEPVTGFTPTNRAQRDDMFLAACHAMQPLISVGTNPVQAAEKAVDHAIELVSQFNKRVRQ